MAAVILREFWNLALSTSRRPYAKPQRKKRIVTRAMGKMDCLTVKADAPVRPLLEMLLRCWLSNASAVDGCRWRRTSSILGSSLENNMVAKGGRYLSRQNLVQVNRSRAVSKIALSKSGEDAVDRVVADVSFQLERKIKILIDILSSKLCVKTWLARSNRTL